MSRYFNSDDSKPSDSRQGRLSARIGKNYVLPEFIPFNEEYKNNKQISIPPPPRQTRSPKQNSDRSSERSSVSRFSDRQMSRENGNSTASPRGSYRSPQKKVDRRSSPPRARINRCNSPPRPKRISPPRSSLSQHSSRNRSRSPQPPRQEMVCKRGDDRGRNPNRRSNERYQGSIFDRMSSPPLPVRRRFREQRSREDSNGSQPHFYRTIDTSNPSISRYEGQLESAYPINSESITDNHPNFSRLQRHSSPSDFSKRYAMGPDEIRSSSLRSRDESVEIHDLRERLIAAEAHCHGLETTVLSYHREIVKLRTIVNDIISDFEVLQSHR